LLFDKSIQHGPNNERKEKKKQIEREREEIDPAFFFSSLEKVFSFFLPEKVIILVF
jgi:hypothetical protein